MNIGPRSKPEVTSIGGHLETKCLWMVLLLGPVLSKTFDFLGAYRSVLLGIQRSCFYIDSIGS